MSPFGKEVRKLRIDADLLLADMAEYLQVTPSYLSSVETGRKPLTDAVVTKTIEYFRLRGIDARSLRNIADQAKKEVNVAQLHASEREAMLALARRFPDVDDARREDLLARVHDLLKESA